MRARVVLVVLAAVLALTPAAVAHARPLVGMGDQKASMFADPQFRALGLRHARIIVPYDELAAGNFWRTDAWMAAARAQGVTPLVALNHSASRPRQLPSLATYRRAVRNLRARYPWVRTMSAWNEANHHKQPTARHPRRAAQYFNAMASVCPSCRIVAADVLDQAGTARWLREFRAVARRPRIWGLHNYGDVNRSRTAPRRSATARFARAARGEVWLTETGGIVQFGRSYLGGGAAHRRAAAATARAFALASSHPRITRLYLYHWSAGTAFVSWDSAFVDAAGVPRPAYAVLLGQLRR